MSIKNLKDEEPILRFEEIAEIDNYPAPKIQPNSDDLQFKKLNTVFEYLIKFISIATIFGIIFGGINVYLYLKKINHLFLFPDNISISNVSVSIFVVYIILYIILSFGFLSPFFVNILLNNISNDFLNKSSKKQIIQNNALDHTNNLISINPKLINWLKFILNTIKLIFLLSIPVLLFISLFFITLIGYILNLFKLFTNIVKNIFFYENKKRDIIYYAKFVYWNMFWFIVFFTIIFFIFLILNISSDKYYGYILYFLTYIFIFFNITYGFIFLNQNKLYKNNIWEYKFWIFMIAMLHILPIFLHFLFVIIPTVGILQNIKIFTLFYILSIIIFLFSLFLSYLSFEDFYKSKKYDYRFHIMSGFFVLVYLFYVSVFSNYEVSLYKTRFIEKPQDSSWYLIHNDNTTSETINGMTKGEIKYRQQFFIPNGWQQYCKDDIFDSVNMQNCTTLRNENALYGYMAWNLGNTKVFCPQSVDFFDDNGDNKEQSQKCLVIDSKYLQLVSEYYLKQPINL